MVQKLIQQPEGALVQKLAAAPGLKEPRYAQLLSGPVDPGAVYAAPSAATAGLGDRVAALETELAELRAEVAELRRQLDAVL